MTRKLVISSTPALPRYELARISVLESRARCRQANGLEADAEEDYLAAIALQRDLAGKYPEHEQFVLALVSMLEEYAREYDNHPAEMLVEARNLRQRMDQRMTRAQLPINVALRLQQGDYESESLRRSKAIQLYAEALALLDETSQANQASVTRN